MTTPNSRVGKIIMSVIAAMIFLLLLFGFLMPLKQTNRTAVREAEAKQNLHSIQLAVERYAVDNEGPYPLWISGGSYAEGNDRPLDDRYLVDPLITEGYMPKFPANPFNQTNRARGQQLMLSELQELLQDPLRPSELAPLAAPSYRFGNDYSLMGSVLADPRFAEILAGTDAAGNPVMKRTGSDVIYPCWDVAAKPDKQYWLQGQFFYKAWGPVFAVHNEETDELTTSVMQAEMYMLGGFGSVRTKGQDVLGEEQTVTVAGEPDRPLEYWNYSGLSVPGFAKRQASPFGINTETGQNDAPFMYGNPNGIRDQVIMVLTAGENESIALKERNESESLKITEDADGE